MDGIIQISENGNKKEEQSTNGTLSEAKDNEGANDANKNSEVDVSLEKSTKPPELSQVFCLETDVDPRPQIRRGEAVQVGGQWFRVSSAVREGPLKDQPARAHAHCLWSL